MDPILQTLLSWQFMLFGLAIAAVVFIVRTIVEYLIENYTPFAKETKLWNDLILPLLPVFLGPIGACLVKKFPYPDGLTDTDSRVIFGLVAGLLSTLLYRVVKALLLQKLDTSSAAAPAPALPAPTTNPAKPPIPDPPAN